MTMPLMTSAISAPTGATNTKKNQMKSANAATQIPSMLPLGLPENTMKPATSWTMPTISSTQPQKVELENRNSWSLIRFERWMTVSPSTTLNAPATTSQMAANIVHPLMPPETDRLVVVMLTPPFVRVESLATGFAAVAP